MRQLLALLVVASVGLPVAAVLSPVAAETVLLAQREGSPNTRSGGDSSDELRTYYQKEITALKKEMAAMREEMNAMHSEMMAMKGDAMKGNANMKK